MNRNNYILRRKYQKMFKIQRNFLLIDLHSKTIACNIMKFKLNDSNLIPYKSILCLWDLRDNRKRCGHHWNLGLFRYNRQVEVNPGESVRHRRLWWRSQYFLFNWSSRTAPLPSTESARTAYTKLVFCFSSSKPVQTYLLAII